MPQSISDQKLREILMVSPAVIYTCRANGDFGATFVSSNITERFGYSVAECLENPNFWRDNIHPDDRERIFAAYEALFQTDRHIHEYRFRKKDGGYIWVHDEVHLSRDAAGNPLELVGSWLDISACKEQDIALQKSDSLFRDFFSANPIATIITHPSGVIHMVNPAFVANSGFSAAELVGQNVQQFGFWESQADRDRLVAAVKQHGFVDNTEVTLFAAARLPRTCLVSSRAIAYEGDLKILSIIIDISEQRRAEKALHELDQLKSNFISTAAHELRTPLTAIIGFSELLADPATRAQISAQQQQDFLRDIFDNGEQLGKMIDALLDITLIEAAQRISLDKQPMSLRGLLEKVVTRPRLKTSHLLELNISSGACPVLQIDPLRIDQVLENLLSNAMKYSPDGSTILLSAEREGNQCKVTVADQGIGMTAAQTTRVFDKFYRVDPSDTAPRGVGLGLNIVKQIISDHGGRVWIESQPGVGTRASFTLPLAPAPADESP